MIKFFFHYESPDVDCGFFDYSDVNPVCFGVALCSTKEMIKRNNFTSLCFFAIQSAP